VRVQNIIAPPFTSLKKPEVDVVRVVFARSGDKYPDLNGGNTSIPVRLERVPLRQQGMVS
jgi:hypothetical protein